MNRYTKKCDQADRGVDEQMENEIGNLEWK